MLLLPFPADEPRSPINLGATCLKKRRRVVNDAQMIIRFDSMKLFLESVIAFTRVKGQVHSHPDNGAGKNPTDIVGAKDGKQ